MLRSFRARLLTGFAVVIALSLFLSASAFILLLREQQAEAAERRIGLLVGPITERASDMELLGWPLSLIRADLESISDYYDVRVMMLDDNSRVVIDTGSDHQLLGEVLEIPSTAPVSDTGRMQSFHSVRLNAEGEDLYLFTSSANAFATPGWSPDTSSNQLVLAVPANDVTAAWAEMLPRLALAGGGAGVVAVIFATLIASRITNPIAQMTRASRAMARGDLNQRIDDAGEDEVGALASAFNQMSTQVSRSNRSMRDLLANVSHELKTPLTSIQGFSQAMVDGLADDPRETGAVINEEAERIRALVNDLLYLSELESGTLQLSLEQVDVDAIVEDTLRRFRYHAEEAGVELRSALGAPAVRADGRRLEQVFANLVDNAIRFAPEGSEVLVRSYRLATQVAVEVQNGGKPIPEEDLPHVFDRFFQSDPARAAGRHRGLGLSIVHELVQAHSGSVAVDSSADAGTTFTVRLPIAGPRPSAERAARQRA